MRCHRRAYNCENFTAKSFQKQVDLWQATKASSVGEENIGQLGHFEGC